MNILLLDLLEPLTSMKLLGMAFLAILFLQSGLDKVFNYKGNFEWLKEHFSKSILKNTVSFMVPTITFLEVAAGVLSLMGIGAFLLDESTAIGLLGAQLSAVCILMLFFGQRIAQDYEGAATLTKYFLVCLAVIFILS